MSRPAPGLVAVVREAIAADTDRIPEHAASASAAWLATHIDAVSDQLLADPRLDGYTPEQWLNLISVEVRLAGGA